MAATPSREDPMSTRSAALPVERSYLVKAWLVVAAIVIVAATTIALALAMSGPAPAGGTDPGPVADHGAPSVTHEPISVNGAVCGQCR
jgi:hypothetical protein